MNMEHKVFEIQLAASIQQSFRILLTNKHLYQAVTLDLEWMTTSVRKMKMHMDLSALQSGPGPASTPLVPLEAVAAELESVVDRYWEPEDPTADGTLPVPRLGKPDYLYFRLPTINTHCSHCDESWPFNPQHRLGTSAQGPNGQQWFFLAYECQQCKGMPVQFLVRRDKRKLILAGRDPIEKLPTPRVLPKRAAKYFSDAVIAHHAGQTLAGLFLLRVFLEQYWRTVPNVEKLLDQNPRATGEDQGSAYNETLPDDFKARFPSLKDIYCRLSEAMHKADGNAELFEEACRELERHFDARRLFEIG